MSNFTRLLRDIDAHDPLATAKLFPLVYDELRALASAKMANERSDHTLQATALVHEAWLRLAGTDEPVPWENRRHFFAAAAEAMRRVLVDAARSKGRQKRTADGQRIVIDLDALPGLTDGADLSAVDEALQRFAVIDPTKAELVKLRFFAGLTTEQAAELLGVSVATAERHWAYARAWLYREVARAD